MNSQSTNSAATLALFVFACLCACAHVTQGAVVQQNVHNFNATTLSGVKYNSTLPGDFNIELYDPVTNPTRNSKIIVDITYSGNTQSDIDAVTQGLFMQLGLDNILSIAFSPLDTSTTGDQTSGGQTSGVQTLGGPTSGNESTGAKIQLFSLGLLISLALTLRLSNSRCVVLLVLLGYVFMPAFSANPVTVSVTVYIPKNIVSDATFASNTVINVLPQTSVTFLGLPGYQPAEFKNGLRGFYMDFGGQLYPYPGAYDNYNRWEWSDIEPTEGNYTYSLIQKELDAAKARQGKFAFRIMTVDTYVSCVRGAQPMPQYYIDNGPMMAHCACSSSGPKNVYVPDFNSDYFLTRIKYLFGNLSSHFASQMKYFAWVDVGTYGNYGEWHLGQIDNCDANLVTPAIQTKKTIMHTVGDAFPGIPVVINYNDGAASNCLAAQTDNIGFRGDTVSGGGFHQGITGQGWYHYAQYQYRVVPFLGELYNFAAGDNHFADAYADATILRMTSFSNGNTDYSTSWDAATLANWQKASKVLGYRFRINSVKYSFQVSPDQCFSASINITNEGSAPVYEKWDVTFQLVLNGSVLWTSGNTLNLRNVLSQDELPFFVGSNSWSLPASLPVGKVLEVRLIITDPSDVRPPMAVAALGNYTSGSYYIGQTQSVASSGTVSCNTTTNFPYIHPRWPEDKKWYFHDTMNFQFQADDKTVTVNRSYTLEAFNGTATSVMFTTTSGGGYVGWTPICGMNISGYNYITLSMKALQPDPSSLYIWCYSGPWTNSLTPLYLSDYGPKVNNTAWSTYHIPLSKCGLNNSTQINSWQIVESGSGLSYLLDEMYLDSNVYH